MFDRLGGKSYLQALLSGSSWTTAEHPDPKGTWREDAAEKEVGKTSSAWGGDTQIKRKLLVRTQFSWKIPADKGRGSRLASLGPEKKKGRENKG